MCISFLIYNIIYELEIYIVNRLQSREMINANDLLKILQKKFKNQKFGTNIYCLNNCSSTNDKALLLAKNNAPDGTIVVALKQTMGRGRFHRTWITNDGGLALSIILRPTLELEKSYRLVLLSASAIIFCLEQLNIKAKLKWPNDILIPEKKNYKNNCDKRYVKVSGILTELISYKKKIKAIILGIGLNISRSFEDENLKFIKNIGFIDDHKKTITIDNVLCSLLKNLQLKLMLIKDEKFLFELNKLRKKCLTLGCEVEVNDNKNKIVGLATSINEDGSLSIKKDNGLISTIYANDVHIKSCINFFD